MHWIKKDSSRSTQLFSIRSSFETKDSWLAQLMLETWNDFALQKVDSKKVCHHELSGKSELETR